MFPSIRKLAIMSKLIIWMNRMTVWYTSSGQFNSLFSFSFLFLVVLLLCVLFLLLILFLVRLWSSWAHRTHFFCASLSSRRNERHNVTKYWIQFIFHVFITKLKSMRVMYGRIERKKNVCKLNKTYFPFFVLFCFHPHWELMFALLLFVFFFAGLFLYLSVSTLGGIRKE